MPLRLFAIWLLLFGAGAALIDCGGGSSTPAIGPVPVPTGLPTSISSDDPVNPLITPAPGPTGFVPVPPTPYPSAAIVVGVQQPASELQESGMTLFGFINPSSSKTATLAVGSSTYVNNDQFSATPPPTTLPGGTFTMQTNAGLGLFGFLRGTAVIDLNATRGNVKIAPSLTQQTDPVLDVPQSRLRGVASSQRSLEAQITPTPPPAIGAVRSWNIHDYTAPNTWSTIQATMLAVATVGGATKGYVWLDNALIVDLGGVQAATALAQRYASYYTTAVAVQGKFGNAPAGVAMTPDDWLPSAPAMSKEVNTCDASGTTTGTDFEYIADPGYVNVVVPQQLSGILGYVWSIDLSPQSVLNCIQTGVYKSNQTSAIYVTYTGETAQKFYLWQTTITHELQHQTSFVGRLINNGYPAQQSWVEEGMGTLAQDYVSANQKFDLEDTGPELVSFLSAPQNFSLTGFAALLPSTTGSGLTLQSNTSKSYALSYLFLKYLADRFGEGILLKIQTDSMNGTAGIADATGTSFNQLIADFTTMIAASNTGIVPVGSPSYAKYNMQSFSLRQSYTPQYVAAFTLAGPATVGALTPNAATSVQNMYYGGFAYFSFGNFVATGSTIKLTDLQSGKLGLTGGIDQQ
jgi:hypothetical protein